MRKQKKNDEGRWIRIRRWCWVGEKWLESLRFQEYHWNNEKNVEKLMEKEENKR